MKPYFMISSIVHGVFLTLVVIVGTFLSKPRMSYYAVDLFSGPPPGAAVSAPEPEKTAPAPEP